MYNTDTVWNDFHPLGIEQKITECILKVAKTDTYVI